MEHLLLVRHAAPVLDPAVPSERWALSKEGERQCARLSPAVARWRPTAIYASCQPKAVRTAELLGVALGLGIKTRNGLQENDREALPFFGDAEAFRGRLRAFFAEPDEFVMGRETATQAAARFEAAVRSVMDDADAGPRPLVVAHGAVISLLVSRANGIDAYSFWERFPVAAFAVVGVPNLLLRDVVTA